MRKSYVNPSGGQDIKTIAFIEWRSVNCLACELDLNVIAFIEWRSSNSGQCVGWM